MKLKLTYSYTISALKPLSRQCLISKDIIMALSSFVESKDMRVLTIR